MAQGRIPMATVRRWLLRGAVVGGAVGAALVLGGPAQAAEPAPTGPVGGLLSGLTTALDGTSGAALELAAGTVDGVAPEVQDAPVVRDVAVVAELPVTDAARGVGDRTIGVVRDLTTTVDQVLAPVVRPVDTVVVEVVPPPVVDAVPTPDEDFGVPDEDAAAPTATAALLTASAVSPVSEVAGNHSAATGLPSAANLPLPTSADAGSSPSGSTGPAQPTGPWPVQDPATGSGSVSGTGGLAGPDLVARVPGRHVSTSDHGGVRPLAPDDALVASSAPVPPFSPD